MKNARLETKKSRILLVDDHPIVVRGIIELIHHEDDLEVCGDAMDAEPALEAVQRLAPDLAIIDLTLKTCSGIEIVKMLQKRFPKLPLLVLSMHDESFYAERAIRAGAKGYIMKDEATENLIKAIRTVMKGEIYLSEKMSSQALRRLFTGESSQPETPEELLSERELEVFEFLGRGWSSRQIAEKLEVSLKTVESHREHIKEKLRVEHGNELLWRAFEWRQKTIAS